MSTESVKKLQPDEDSEQEPFYVSIRNALVQGAVELKAPGRLHDRCVALITLWTLLYVTKIPKEEREALAEALESVLDMYRRMSLHPLVKFAEEGIARLRGVSLACLKAGCVSPNPVGSDEFATKVDPTESAGDGPVSLDDTRP